MIVLKDFGNDGLSILDEVPKFKPGDPPPQSYSAWHDWAKVQDRAGLKQVRCAVCGLWRFPSELSDHTTTTTYRSPCGTEPPVLTSAVCLGCAAKMDQQEGKP